MATGKIQHSHFTRWKKQSINNSSSVVKMTTCSLSSTIHIKMLSSLPSTSSSRLRREVGEVCRPCFDCMHIYLDELTSALAIPLVECLGLSLNDASRFPSWLEPNRVAQGGCLVAGVGFCANIKRFTNKEECKVSLRESEKLASECSDKGKGIGIAKAANDHCKQMAYIARQQKQFCETCGKQPQCHVDSFKANSWQSETKQ